MTKLKRSSSPSVYRSEPVPARRWLTVWLLLIALAGAPAFAQETVTQLRIGVVNAARLLDEAPQAKQALKRLEEEFQPRDQRLLELQRHVRDLEDRLLDRGRELSDGERRELERELRDQRRDLRRTEDELREDFNLRRNEELSKLQQLIIETIVGLAKKERYDLILNQDTVIFAGDRVELTGKVLQQLQRAQ
ncbi:MAG: OmpH family outer membrane protein [Candidatus Competibacterales bacterium]|nr:OmpH family outer membrane protein [Candidatus Competibacterales bacterium]